MNKRNSNIINYILVVLYFIIGTQYLIQYHEVAPLSAVSLLYSFFLIKRLFDALGKKLPYKELILALMGLQLLIAPYLEYYYFYNEIFGVMRVDEHAYFSFVLPAILAIHIGLNLFHPQETYEKELLELLANRKSLNSKIGIGLIIVGYLFYSLSDYVPSVLGFVATALSFMRFIGFFYLWVAGSKYSKLAFAIVFIPFLLLTVRATIFIDFLVLSILITSVYIMKYQLAKWKVIMFSIFGFFSLFILQSVKYSYRNIVWSTEFQGNSGVILTDMMLNQVLNINSLDFKTVGASINVRLNQGWIITGILDNMPARKPFAEGSYLKKEALGLLLPRFLYPDKPIVGDRKKFENFVGWQLGQGTAMNVGIIGDGYGNFGPQGGIMFCFLFGLSLGYLFNIFYRLARRYPTLPIWGVLIFFYSMRAGNEFYIISNWIIKTGVLVSLYYFLIENNNRITNYFRPNISDSNLV